MRHVRSNARLGELDEEFVWENREGSRFSLGAQSWRVERITPSDVFVSPSPMPPPRRSGRPMGRTAVSTSLRR